VPAARWQQRVDVAGRAAAGKRSQGEVAERVGEQLRDERDREPSGDEAADGELIVGDRNEPRLEARRSAGADDQPVGHGGRPVLCRMFSIAFILSQDTMRRSVAGARAWDPIVPTRAASLPDDDPIRPVARGRRPGHSSQTGAPRHDQPVRRSRRPSSA
jgi:hypothetical protein